MTNSSQLLLKSGNQFGDAEQNDNDFNNIKKIRPKLLLATL